MNFGTAIKTCFNKYADFDGRASRSEYWFFYLFFLLSSGAIYFISMSILIKTSPSSDGVVKFLFSVPSIWALAITIPLCAACARRLHDVNRSGWWQLAPIGLIFISVFCFYQFPDTPRIGQFVLVGAVVYIIRVFLWLVSEGTTKGYTGSTKRRASARDYDDAPKQRSRSGKVDLTDELEELQELYEDGTLSEAQFKKAKNKLLK